jgi:FtsP/CotA-like multicopper oxidase with cupredoxin domain
VIVTSSLRLLREAFHAHMEGVPLIQEFEMHRRDLFRLLSLSALAGATGCDGQSTSPVPAGLSPQTTQVPGFEPDVEFVLTAEPNEVSVLPGEPTRVWRFAGQLLKGPADTLENLPGSYLGPVIRLRRGQKVRVRFVNRLGEDSIVHWHGLDVPDSADGHPRLAIGHSQEYVYEFELTNRAGNIHAASRALPLPLPHS